MRRYLLAVAMLAGVVALAACKLDDSGSGQNQNAGQQRENAQNPAQVGGPQFGGQPDTGFQGTPGPFPTIDPTVSATFQDLNRLSVGMLYLQESSHPLTQEQAVTLLPYWQNIQAAMQPQEVQGQPPAGDQTPGPDEPSQGGAQGQGRGNGRGFMMSFDTNKVASELANVKAALTQEQVSDINSLTQDQMNSTLLKYGLNVNFGGQGGRNGGPGRGDNGGFSGTPGAFETARAEGTFPPRQTPDANELATRQAQRGSGQGGQRSNPVIDEVIKMLQSLAGN